MSKLTRVLVMGALVAILAVSGIRSAHAAPSGGATICTDSVSGTVAGDVIVPTDATCFIGGATIGGNVIAHPGAILIIQNSTVQGNILADGAQVVEVALSQVRGNVELRGGTLQTEVFKNTIGGQVILAGNSGQSEVFQNSIGKHLNFDSNSGTNFIGDNTITGMLQCEGNVPPPSSFGNTARKYQGQCAPYISGRADVTENQGTTKLSHNFVDRDVHSNPNSGDNTVDQKIIAGALECIGNTPAPTGHNVSQGNKGQCAADVSARRGPVTSPVQATPLLAGSLPGLTASFVVRFESRAPGQGYVLFGPGPGCTGLTGTATQDHGAGTTQHSVTVAGDEMNLSAGAVLPGATYSFKVETVSNTGVEIDDNGGKCYTVTIPSFAEAVPCSAAALITAIDQANAGGGGYLRLSPKCTYTLTAAQGDTEDGLPQIRSSITIDGEGATITRSTDPNTPAFRIFEVMGRANLNLRSLTLSNGNAPGPEPDGGGAALVLEQGGLFASSVVVRDNIGALGGGVDNFGSTDIANSVLSGNQALHGAGVSSTSPSATLILTNTLIAGNHALTDAGVAGGVFNQEGGSASLVNVSVTGNIGDNSAGGVRNDAGSTMGITNSQISQNQAGPLFNAPTTVTGGGIQNLGTLVLRDTTVERNHAAKTGLPTVARGGGIANLHSDEQGASPPDLTLINSSVTNNVADDGPGGIYNDGGTVALTHTPVTDNVPTNCSGSPSPVPGCSG